MDEGRDEIVMNGQRVGDDSVEAAEIRRRIAAHKGTGRPYPSLRVDDYYEVPFFWWGRTAYHAETYERLIASAAARNRAVELPPDFEIDGETPLPRETKMQHQQYLAFRDLGPDRSIGQLRKVLGWGKKSHGNLTGTRIRYRWDERCAAYDMQMEAEKRRAAQELIQQQIAIEIEHRNTYLTNEWTVVERGFEVVREMLNYPVVEKKETRISEDGKTIVTIWQPGRWTLATVASLLDALSKMGRLNTGLVTSNAGTRQDSAATDRERERQQRETRDAEEEAMHQFASMRAEEAYFAACEEWKERRAREMGTKAPVPALQARVA
jgi:hypothetical protein